MYGNFHISPPFPYSEFIDLTKNADWSPFEDQDQDQSPTGSTADDSQLYTPSGVKARVNSFEYQQHLLLDRLISNIGRPTTKHSSKRNTKTHESPCANATRATSFGFGANDDGSTQARTDKGLNGANRSVDNINTKFTNDDSQSWQFQASPIDKTADPNQKSQPISRKGVASPVKVTSTQPDEAVNGTQSGAAQAASAFNAQGWNDQFGPQNFVPRPASSASPTRSTRPAGKKGKTAKTTGSAAVLVDSSSGEEELGWKGRSRPREAESPQAMDIDSPPTISISSSSSLTENGARNKSVEPSRREWRSGDANVNTAGSEDTEEFRATFADFKKVEPFAAEQGTGLKSFATMKDTLPFESKAATPNMPPPLPKAPPLSFPSPPAAPICPPFVAIDSIEASQEGADKYTREFQEYMVKWDDFNAQVVDHFASRKVQIGAKRSAEGYKFLDMVQGDAGAQEYFVSLQQDNGVRQNWLRACEIHEVQFRDYMVFRLKRA